MNQISAGDEIALRAAFARIRQQPRPSSIADAAAKIHQVANGALADSEVTDGFIGRFFECPSYLIKTDRFEAALPRCSPEEIQAQDHDKQRSRDFWESINWFHPAFVTNGDIWDLHRQVKSGVNPEQALEAFLIRQYDHPENIAATVSQKYDVVPGIKERTADIWECICTFYSGYTGPAIASLLTLVEACFCNWGGVRLKDKADQALEETIDRSLGHYASRLIYLNRWVPEAYLDRDFLADVDEVAHCLVTFRRYFTRSLFANTERFTERNELNRNGILHGLPEFRSYRTRANFFKLLSVLDMAAFAHILGQPGLKVGLQPAVASPADRYEGAELRALGTQRTRGRRG